MVNLLMIYTIAIKIDECNKIIKNCGVMERIFKRLNWGTAEIRRGKSVMVGLQNLCSRERISDNVHPAISKDLYLLIVLDSGCFLPRNGEWD